MEIVSDKVMMNQNLVFLVDNDSQLRDSVTTLARQKSFAIDVLSSGDEFLSSNKSTAMGCIVVDVGLEHAEGMELVAKLKAKKAAMPTIATARHADIPLAVKAMQAGASTFLTKPVSDDDLWNAIEAAFAADERQRPLRQELAELEARLAALTAEEVEVFRRMMAGHPNKQISTDLDLGLRTVEMRRANITRKMKAASAPDLARMAILLDVLKLQKPDGEMTRE